MAQNLCLLCALGCRDGAQDGVQSSKPQRMVVGNGEPVMLWRLDLENNVAAFPVHLPVTVMLTEDPDQFRPIQIARQFHAGANTSSRTRCSRMQVGLGWSKKYAETASRTFTRNCSHVSPSVKMSCDRHSATKPPSPSWVTLNTISMPALWHWPIPLASNRPPSGYRRLRGPGVRWRANTICFAPPTFRRPPTLEFGPWTLDFQVSRKK